MHKSHCLLILFIVLFRSDYKQADPSHYLDGIKLELQKQWPGNRTINLVFHGHSVPAGYFKTPVVNSFASYPYQLLKEIKKIYPFAVVNVINTSIGGENSIKGAARFTRDVMVHKPDIVFIDYGLNDRGIDSLQVSKAWESMIRAGLRHKIKVILLTPSPDQTVAMLSAGNELEKQANHIRQLADKFEIGLADSYEVFKQRLLAGDSLTTYMSQVNHPNEEGHTLITQKLMEFFR